MTQLILKHANQEQLKDEPIEENLGRFFADRVTSKHNQNVMIRFVAIAGMGKSWSALRLAYDISKNIALKLKGKPEDFFSFNEDLAVISLEKVTNVMENARPYHVILLDDVTAKAMNARNYASVASKDLNAIIQTWRPNHNALITTQQASFLVDKVWRNLFNFQIEIVESHFDQGFVVCKVQEIKYKHNLDKTFYPYLTHGNTRYVRHIITAPPYEWRAAYEAERAKQLEDIRTKEEEQATEQQYTPKEKYTQEKIFLPMILKILEKGVFSKVDLQKELINLCGTAPSVTTIKEICYKHKLLM